MSYIIPKLTIAEIEQVYPAVPEFIAESTVFLLACHFETQHSTEQSAIEYGIETLEAMLHYLKERKASFK